MSVRLSELTISQGSLAVLNPSEAGTTTGFTSPSAFYEPVTLTTTGTHSILLDPSNDFTGSVNVTL